MKTTLTLSLIAIISFFLVAFSSCEKSSDIVDNPIGQPGEVGNTAEMNQQFGWDLFKELVRENPEENVLYSPWSVQTAMNMALNAAGGNTLDEMLEVLHCSQCPVEEINAAQAEMRKWLEEKSGHPSITSANAFFYDDARIYVKEDFLTSLKKHYNATDRIYQFGDPATLDKINNWVMQNTNDKIEKILEKIEDEDLAFLINALHFKADWSNGFDENATHDANFALSDRTTVRVPFMNADRNFNHVRQNGLSMVDIPFRDSTFSLSLILSDDHPSDAMDWIDQLDMTTVNALYDNLDYGRIMLSFPRLDLEFDTDLPDAMKKLGMVDAFSEFQANFEPLGHALIGPVIYINQMKHKAVLKVDEKGAEGAAVTSIGFGTTSLPPQFTYNKPFVLILRHVPSNTYLFQGLVENPSS
nr:serpin family protein [Saprospiraceae bacterium]